MINIKNLKPAYTFHPGELLWDEMTARHITVSKMIRLSQIPRRTLLDILNCKQDIDKHAAACIGNAFKMDPQIWLNLQASYDELKKQTNGR